MELNDFEKDLMIDPNQLDLMAAIQGELFFKWAEKAVKARKKADEAKFNLDVTQADLSSQARIDPGSFGIVKVTEAAITEAVKIHPKYKEANQEYLEAKADSALLDKGVEAMEQKKRMIEVLITLHGQQYFAGPSVPRNLVEAWKEEKEKRSDRVNKKTKLRKKKK